MHIAWGTIAILALLLPGVFFLRGSGLAERFSRDATPRSPAAFLALTVLVSLLAHAISITAIRSCVPDPPDLRAILMLASGQFDGPSEMTRAVDSLTSHEVMIAVYFAGLSMVSLLSGWGLGAMAIRFPTAGRIVFEHEWLHSFHGNTPPALVYALTNLELDDSMVLNYRVLDQFGIRQDGRFSFMVLKGPWHAMLPRPSLDEKAKWKPVQPNLTTEARLYLDGDSIKNVLLDTVPLGPAERAGRPFASEALSAIKEAQKHAGAARAGGSKLSATTA